MLTVQERDSIVMALYDWAVNSPNEPVVGFLGTTFYTPKELYQQVLKETDDGNAVLEILERGVRAEGIATVVKRLTSDWR
jgi:hypothetical protein